MYQNRFYSFFLLVFLLAGCTSGPPSEPEITAEELEAHIGYLASEELSGRYPGTAGDLKAARYISRSLREAGLAPLYNNGLQAFDIVTNIKAGPDNKLRSGNTVFEAEKEFRPMSFSSDTSARGKLLFAGFGLVLESESNQWNDYSGLEVRDNWVMMLRFDPGETNGNNPFAMISDDRDKCMQAKDLGAAGVLMVAGTRTEARDHLLPLKTNEAGVGIPVFQITRKTANRLLPEMHSIEELEQQIVATKKPYSFLTGTTIEGRADLEQEFTTTYNVVYRLRAGNNNTGEYLLAGAHYDHLGMGGEETGSRARDTLAIHYGADDNASGVAGILETAEYLAARKDSLKRDVIFMAFGAEEMGLLGSKKLVEDPPAKLENASAMVNLDMIGRLKESRKLQVGGTGTAAEFDSLLTLLTDTMELTLVKSREGYGPSDHSSFYGKGIPVLFLSTGAHTDYHTPRDSEDKINYEGLTTVCRWTARLIMEAAMADSAMTFMEAGPRTSSRGHMRRGGVTLGIMPDVAGEVKNGLRADFVTPGKPAAIGGMKNGDVITAINGLEISNIYDYMYRLSKLEHGQTINVEVRRNGEKTVLLIQL